MIPLRPLPKPFYQDEYATIYCADCRSLANTLGRFDLLLTDPPYGISEAAGKNKSRSKLAIAKDYGDDNWDDEPPETKTITALRYQTDFQIIWGGNYFELPPTSCWLVWDKENGETDFADCELAWTNFKKAVRLRRHQWHGMLRKGREARFHPTQKPVELISWCIQKLYPECNTIFDPYMGSGTTLVAAKRLKKRCVGIEREKKYCEVAVERLRQEYLL